MIKKLRIAARRGDISKVRELIESNEFTYWEIHGPYNGNGEKKETLLCNACLSGNLELVEYLFDKYDEFGLYAPIMTSDNGRGYYYQFGALTNSIKSNNIELTEYILTKTKEWIINDYECMAMFDSRLNDLLCSLTIGLAHLGDKTEFIMLFDKHDCLKIALKYDKLVNYYDEDTNEYEPYTNVLNAGRFDLFELFMNTLPVPKPIQNLREYLNDNAKRYLYWYVRNKK